MRDGVPAGSSNPHLLELRQSGIRVALEIAIAELIEQNLSNTQRVSHRDRDVRRKEYTHLALPPPPYRSKPPSTIFLVASYRASLVCWFFKKIQFVTE